MANAYRIIFVRNLISEITEDTQGAGEDLEFKIKVFTAKLSLKTDVRKGILVDFWCPGAYQGTFVRVTDTNTGVSEFYSGSNVVRIEGSVECRPGDRGYLNAVEALHKLGAITRKHVLAATEDHRAAEEVQAVKDNEEDAKRTIQRILVEPELYAGIKFNEEQRAVLKELAERE